MLVICQFFASEMLQSEFSLMNNVVDRFFKEDWILSVHPSSNDVINLVEVWDAYK